MTIIATIQQNIFQGHLHFLILFEIRLVTQRRTATVKTIGTHRQNLSTGSSTSGSPEGAVWNTPILLTKLNIMLDTIVNLYWSVTLL